jgi:tetratricopeptide (TPR) repeat protein
LNYQFLFSIDHLLCNGLEEKARGKLLDFEFWTNLESRNKPAREIQNYLICVGQALETESIPEAIDSYSSLSSDWETQIDVLGWVGSILDQSSLYDLALEVFQSAERLLIPERSAYSPATLRFYKHWIRTLTTTGNYGSALELIRPILKHLGTVYGEESGPYLRASSDYANILTRQGDSDKKEAERIYSRLIDINQQSGDTDALLSAQGLLINLLIGEDQLEEAEQLLKRHIKSLQEHEFSLESIYRAESKLGLIYSQSGRSIDAERVLGRLYQNQVDLQGEMHEDTVATATKLTAVYTDLGDHQQAQRFGRIAVNGYTALFGGDHYDTAVAVANLAYAHEAAGDSDLALKYLDSSTDSFRRLGYPRYAATNLNKAGNIFHGLGDYLLAKERFESAVELCESVHGVENSETMVNKYCLGRSLRFLEEFEEAINVLERVLIWEEQNYEEEDLVLTRFFLAESYNAVNRSEDSYTLYDAVLRWELKFCSPEDAQYTAKSMLPVVRLMGLKDVEAELEALINQ